VDNSSSKTAPARVLSPGPSHEVQSFRNRLLQHGSPMGSQVLPANLLQHGLHSLHGATDPVRSLLQHGLPKGSQPPLGHIHLLWNGVLQGLQVDICSTVDLNGLQGDSLSHHDLLHRLQGNICSGIWGTSPSFCTDLGVCRAVSLTPLLRLPLHSSFFPLLKYVFAEELPLSLMDLALASSRSVLGLVGIGSIGHGGRF